jgi:hypothetical protein
MRGCYTDRSKDEEREKKKINERVKKGEGEGEQYTCITLYLCSLSYFFPYVYVIYRITCLSSIIPLIFNSIKQWIIETKARYQALKQLLLINFISWIRCFGKYSVHIYNIIDMFNPCNF